MREDILENLQREIYGRCQRETNKFGMPGLLYLAYVQKGMGLEEGKEFVKNKLMRSFQKLSPESREHYRNKYQKVMEVLG